MRIALVVPGGVDRSAQVRVIPVLLAFIERLSLRHQVVVFALHQEEQAAEWPLLGARVINLGAGGTRRRAVRAIIAEHRRSRFDLVHAFFGGAPAAVAVLAARWLGVPCMVHVAGGELTCLPEIGYGGALSVPARMRERAVLRCADRVTAASAPMCAALAAIGVASERVPLGVDLGQWVPSAPRARVPGSAARLIHVASLNRVKDQPTLLRALAQMMQHGVDFTIEVIGEDTLGGTVQRLAADLGLAQRVKFFGFLPQRTLREHMLAADLMMVSSLHEAGPVAILEAATVGVPCVGTRVGHLAEWAGTAAVAVAPGDWNALGRDAAALLDDEPRRLRLANEARCLATTEDADFTDRAFRRIYEELASRAR